MSQSEPATVALPADLLAAEDQMLKAVEAAIQPGDGRRWSAALSFENLGRDGCWMLTWSRTARPLSAPGGGIQRGMTSRGREAL